MFLGAALPLQVDRHEIRPGRQEKEDDPAAMPRITHKRGDLPEDSARHPRVPLHVTVAQSGIRLVDHYGDRRHGLQQVQDLLEITLCDALPLRAKILELHHGDADLAGEAGDHKRLARPYGPAHEIAHRHHITATLLQCARRIPQMGLRFGVSGHHIQVVVRLDEFEHSVRFGLDELLLHLGEDVERENRAILEYISQNRSQLDEPESCRIRGNNVESYIRMRLKHALAIAHIPVRELPAAAAVRHRDLDLRRIGALNQLLIQIRQILGNEAEREITREKERIVCPFPKEDQGAAVLGGVHGRLGHGDHRLRVVDHAGDALAVRHAYPEVVLEDREYPDRVLRQLLCVFGTEYRIVSGQRAIEVAL